MIESIVDKDLHNKLLNTVGREKMKTTFKSNLRPFICWYLCAGNDFMAIKRVLELNRANDLEDPYFFIFTDNNYFCSEDGKASVWSIPTLEDQQAYFDENFDFIQSIDFLPDLNMSQKLDLEKDFKLLEKDRLEYFDYLLSRHFKKASFEEIKRARLHKEGYSIQQIDMYFEGIALDTDYDDVWTPDLERLLSELCFADATVHDEYVEEIKAHIKSHLGKRKMGNIYKHKEKDLFLVLLTTENVEFAKSKLGQQTNSIIGAQNWGHDLIKDIAPIKDFKVYYQLCSGANHSPNRSDIQLINMY